MIAAILGYALFAGAIAGLYILGTRRAYDSGHDDGWDACTEELVIDADAADDAVQQHDDLVRSYLIPILQQRTVTRDMPLHTLDAESLLRLLQTSEPTHPKSNPTQG